MLHHMKQHLTPEVAQAHFKSGKSTYRGSNVGCIVAIVSIALMFTGLGMYALILPIIYILVIEKILGKSAKSKMMQLTSLPTITEDVCVNKEIETSRDSDGQISTTYYLVFAHYGKTTDARSGDEYSTTHYDNVYIGQKFYVASWPEGKHKPLFYAQDYWRLEELTPGEQATAEEVERLAVEDFVRSVNMDKARRITARHKAPADKKQSEYKGACRQQTVSENAAPGVMTVAAKIAAQCFDRSLSAAVEYLTRERDPETRERYKNLLNRDELELYNDTVAWQKEIIKKHLIDVVDSSTARDIADKYDADPWTKRVSRKVSECETAAEEVAVRRFKKCMNALMEYVIVYLDEETNERFADQITDEEYALYQEVMNKIRQGC